jgi:hypothetical protein
MKGGAALYKSSGRARTRHSFIHEWNAKLPGLVVIADGLVNPVILIVSLESIVTSAPPVVKMVAAIS